MESKIAIFGEATTETPNIQIPLMQCKLPIIFFLAYIR